MNTQVRLGAFVLLAIVITGLLSVKIGRLDFAEGDGVIVEALFDDVAGLEEKTAVRMAGVRVGSVESIALEGNRALVRIRLLPKVVLPASTRARLVSGGLVGEKFLSLSARPNDTTPLPPGSRIPTVPSGGIGGLVEQAERVADDIHRLTGTGATAIGKLAAILDENRGALKETIRNLQRASRAANDNLPQALNAVQQASAELAALMRRHKRDLDRTLKQLPKTMQAGHDFFASGRKTFADADRLLEGNRENIYRMIFEMRKAAENLDALSDDLRRNPWKLTNKTREVPPSPRARQEKMEELMLSTGRMGLAPARK